MNDVAGTIEDVEEIDIVVPQIPTRMVERTADVSQISTDQQTVPGPQVTTQVVDRPCPMSQFRQWTFQRRHDSRDVQSSMKPVDVPVLTAVVSPLRDS